MTRALTKLQINELSLVDNPANQKAFVSIFKRKKATDDTEKRGKLLDQVVDDIVKAYGDNGAIGFAQLLQEVEDRRRMWEVQDELWPLFDALTESVRRTIADVDKELSDRMTIIRQSVSDFIDAVADKVPDVEEELSKLFKPNPASAGISKEGDDPMPKPEERIAELEKQVSDLTGQLEKANAQVETEKARADAAEKSAKALEDDDTIKIGGEIIKKSAVGEVTFKALKASQEETQKAREETRTEQLKSRAKSEFGHLPGTDDDKAKALHVVEDIEDEDTRKALTEMLKGGEKATAEQLIEKGRTGAGEDPSDDPNDKMEKMASDYASEHKVTKSAAHDHLSQNDPDYRRLYSEYTESRKRKTS